MGRNDGISEYCRAEDGSWVICKWENALWVPERREWLDCWRVTVQLPEGVASPWFPDLESVSVGITFNTYDEAWAHVRRSDLMVWALTEHARDLSSAVVHWRRRTYDLDPDNRAPGALKDIRCAILDTGWPLGDDSDPEMTPVRLVKEILAENAKLRARDAAQALLLFQARLLYGPPREQDEEHHVLSAVSLLDGILPRPSGKKEGE